MDSSEKPIPNNSDGMAAYEFLVNNIDATPCVVDEAVDKLDSTDTTGQFAASAARFLAAMGQDRFTAQIDRLLKQAIEKDREKAYLPSLLSCIWGEDYSQRVEELREKDDNFRRIYKRVHPSGVL